MREKIALTLALIAEGHNINEIQNILNINNIEFNKILKAIKDSGYNLSRNYSSDGQINLKLNKSTFTGERKSLRINVIDKSLRVLFISDLHIGSIYENPSLLKLVYKYAKDHNCHIIFNGGDLIENIYPDAAYPPKIPSVELQLKKVLRIYPYDSNIINFILYGNHDYRSLTEEGLDISRYLEERRYVLVSLGYCECIIHLKDDAIAITHDLKRTSKNEIPNNVSAVYRGHSHKSKTRDNKIIYIPALSENGNSAYEFRPLVGFLDAEFLFYDKKIARINMKQLAILKNEIRLANEETMILQPNFQERPRQFQKKAKK